jgi:hypothetical protein
MRANIFDLTFLIDSPVIVIPYASWINLSNIALAIVGFPMAARHFSTGAWLAPIVDLRP